MKVFSYVRRAAGFIGRGPLAVASGVAVVGATLMATSGTAFATCTGSYCGNGGDSVDVVFGTAATSILGYLTDAVALVLAVFILGLGIRMLIKWAHRAVAST